MRAWATSLPSAAQHAFGGPDRWPARLTGPAEAGHALVRGSAVAWACYTVAMRDARLDGLHAASIAAVGALFLSGVIPGLLLAVNSNCGAPASTRLVTINTATGVVATIGALPDDTDALAFTGGSGPNLAPTFSTLNPGLRVVVAVVSTILVVLAAFVLLRGRRR